MTDSRQFNIKMNFVQFLMLSLVNLRYTTISFKHDPFQSMGRRIIAANHCEVFLFGLAVIKYDTKG